MNGFINVPLKEKKAHNAGKTDSINPTGRLLSPTFAAKPHKTPDMKARIIVP